jgi:hypothetical protein
MEKETGAASHLTPVLLAAGVGFVVASVGLVIAARRRSQQQKAVEVLQVGNDLGIIPSINTATL